MQNYGRPNQVDWFITGLPLDRCIGSRTIRETELTGHGARCIARDPQSNTIAVGIRDRIELWDIDQGQRRHTLAQGGDTYPGALAFNADGSRLFSGDSQGVVKVWYQRRRSSG